MFLRFLIAIFLLLGTSLATAEEITLATDDGFMLPATLIEPETKNGAGIVLIHQGGSSRGEWVFMHNRLLGAGYVIISYDIRGMGDAPKMSGDGKEIKNIYNAPNQATLDLKAAIKRIKKVDGVDTSRIGILGASIGGNLAAVGSAQMDIKSSVAISGKTEAVQNLASDKNIRMQNVYYISSMESDGARSKWAEEMFNLTDGLREIAITPDESGHGVTILQDRAFLQDQIMDWFKRTL